MMTSAVVVGLQRASELRVTDGYSAAMIAVIAVAAFGVTACGGEAGPSGRGADSGDLGVPLLDRPEKLEYDCSVSRPMTELGIDPWGGGPLLAAAPGAYLLRSEWQFAADRRIVGSTVAADGALGSAVSVYDAPNSYTGQLSAVTVGDRFTVLWGESLALRGSEVRVSQINGAGAVLAGPFTVAAGTDLRNPELAATPAGYAAVWEEVTETGSTLRFARLDSSGALDGSARTVIAGRQAAPNSLTALGDRLLLIYTRDQAGSDSWASFYTVLDADGVMQGEPVELGNGYGASSALVRGDRWLVAWTEQGGSVDYDAITSDGSAGLDELTGAYRTLRVGFIDASGRLSEKYAVQAPVIDEENTDPHWIDMGDDVGLAWSRGSMIYICGGCYPDNTLAFTVLDGQDLQRKSAVLELVSPTPFGLMRPRALQLGSELLVVADVTRHVDAEGASATLRCAKKSPS